MRSSNKEVKFLVARVTPYQSCEGRQCSLWKTNRVFRVLLNGNVELKLMFWKEKRRE